MQNTLLAYTINTLRILANIFPNKCGVFSNAAILTAEYESYC